MFDLFAPSKPAYRDLLSEFVPSYWTWPREDQSYSLQKSAEGHYLTVPVPGCTKDDVSVTFDDVGTISVSWSAKDNRSGLELSGNRQFRANGVLKKSVQNAKATVTNGLLEVFIPATQDSKEAPNKIPVS